MRACVGLAGEQPHQPSDPHLVLLGVERTRLRFELTQQAR